MARAILVLSAIGTLAGCSTDRVDPFKPVPECKGPTLTPLAGDRQMVISTLSIADQNVGFDLNRDGKIDNVLAALSSVAQPYIDASFNQRHDLVVPVELFGYSGVDAPCVKLAFYVGKFNQDRDHDGRDTNGQNGDCLDIDQNVPTDEQPGNRLDDDCDGLADNPMPHARPSGPAADMDLDGDGYSLAQGDCDDRVDTPEHRALAMTRHPGATEVCGDGIDQNCDGLPDNAPECNPFGENDVTVDVTALSFDAAMQPLINFRDGRLASNVISAGPDAFGVSLPFRAGTVLTLDLKGARLRMALTDDAPSKKTHVTDGLLGGVLEAVTMAQITGIDGGDFIHKEDTLLDAIFVGGSVTAALPLDVDKDYHLLPDIDVDGDGKETFYQENVDAGGRPHVDTCKDGDGTIVRNNFDGKGTPCALAKDKNGNFRFVDGLSVALTFKAVPVVLGKVVPQ
jgi:hypothetical protein